MKKRVSRTSPDKQKSKGRPKVNLKESTNALSMLMNPLPNNILDLSYPGFKKSIDKTKLRISHWNVNGIRAILKKQDFTDYLENTQLDILCLNETKINKKKFLKSPIERYC
jgi:hypothetical protein